MLAIAVTTDTSCSVDRPPNITATVFIQLVYTITIHLVIPAQAGILLTTYDSSLRCNDGIGSAGLGVVVGPVVLH